MIEDGKSKLLFWMSIGAAIGGGYYIVSKIYIAGLSIIGGVFTFPADAYHYAKSGYDLLTSPRNSDEDTL